MRCFSKGSQRLIYNFRAFYWTAHYDAQEHNPDSQYARQEGSEPPWKRAGKYIFSPSWNTFLWIRHWQCPTNVFQNRIPGQIYESSDIMSIMTLTFGLEQYCPIK